MKKQRTRQHIIEDLGLNHIEKQILLSGNVWSRYPTNDYSYDGMIETFNKEGEAENQVFMVQLKSTDSIQLSPQKEGFIVDLSKKDLERWLTCAYPVLLILYDAQQEIAYFTDLQTYFNENRFVLKKVRKFVNIYLQPKSIFNNTAIQELQKILK
jgi:Domain of unknown function (DUF4365)